ncbi:MAG: glycine/sarcosine/betaine reductase selenoprotein B family protein [Acidimicrobiales bacterium]
MGAIPHHATEATSSPRLPRSTASVIHRTVRPRAFRARWFDAPRREFGGDCARRRARHRSVHASHRTAPLDQARIGLMSSAGIFLADSQPPFDVERERREPTWGDPTLRVIPNDVSQSQLDARHLHINTTDLLVDMNVALPIERLNELAEQGVIGSASPEHYSVMGFQEEGAEQWRTVTGPEIAARCRAADIDALILAPA